MQLPFNPKPIALSIAAVERDTGLSKDTLRVWERRYGFPAPYRDSLGERSYPFDQVERLRTIRRLLEAGHRPGRVVPMAGDDLERLAATIGSPPRVRREPVVPGVDAEEPDRRALMASVVANDVDRLRDDLAFVLARLGLGRFVLDVVAPMNLEVGDAWMQGRLEVFQEHLYTETMQGVLRAALQHLPARAAGRPRVLLATVSGEPHGLGLLMAEAVLSLEGCRCISLGTQTPVWDIARAASALDAQVVALGFTGCTSPGQVTDGLVELRAKLPPSIELWAGGSAPVLQRRVVSGVRAVTTLDGVGAALAEWHRHHPAPSA